MLNPEQIPINKKIDESEISAEQEQVIDNIKKLYKKSLSKSDLSEIDKSMTEEAYKTIKSLLSEKGEFCTDVNEAYKACREELVVRREDPMKVINLISDDTPIKVSFDKSIADRKKEKSYANCAIFKNSDVNVGGLKNAFREGFGQIAGIAMVVGFKPSKDFEISDIKISEKSAHGIDRQSVRSGKGIINPGDVKFVSIRIPGDLMPINEITGTEEEILDEYENSCDAYEEQRDISGIKKADKPSSPEFFRGFIPKIKEDAA